MYSSTPAIIIHLSNLIHTVISNSHTSLLHNVLPEFTSPHQNRAWLIFPALLINIGCMLYKWLPHCHSQYYGKWQLWTRYEQFHGWAPFASWQYGSYDRFGTGGLATHLPYCLCLAHSLTLTYLDVPFNSQLQRIGQRRK